MLTPQAAPLACFGLEHQAHDPRCQQCPHAPGCRVHMGPRLARISLARVQFSLVPDTFVRRHEETNPEDRDIEALYGAAHHQVYACDPSDAVGSRRARVLALARQARCPVPLFLLTCMFAHATAFPGKKFTSGLLVDGRTSHRVKLYGDACRRRYADFSPHALALLDPANPSLALATRMARSEILAARGIIDYKLQHAGQPWDTLLEALAPQLDPAWLAIEPAFTRRLLAYSRRELAALPETDIHHQALVYYHGLKKHKHRAIATFLAREAGLRRALPEVLGVYGLQLDDFEVENKKVLDPLHFWGRIALAIQHLESLRYVNYGEGLYARPA